MKISILGTGMVGQSLAAALIAKGHDVSIGTRDVAKSIANETTTPMGMPGFGTWYKTNSKVKVVPFAEAISSGELLINATSGPAVLEILAGAAPASINGKVLIDISNDLDFSNGMPPTVRLQDKPGASIGERIQATFPSLRVVKSLSTMNAFVMVNPAMVPGESTIFVSGNDADAKAKVSQLLKDFGWNDILDLGDITSARAVELMLPVWLRLWNAIGKPGFNFKIVR
jgi:8-hydroxy-5-deazaflavin:NADPH oxidoreductase